MPLCTLYVLLLAQADTHNNVANAQPLCELEISSWLASPLQFMCTMNGHYRQQLIKLN